MSDDEKPKKKVIQLKMLDLIRAGTPTLPESGDVFHFKQSLGNEEGKFRKIGVPGTYDICTL